MRGPLLFQDSEPALAEDPLELPEPVPEVAGPEVDLDAPPMRAVRRPPVARTVDVEDSTPHEADVVDAEERTTGERGREGRRGRLKGITNLGPDHVMIGMPRHVVIPTDQLVPRARRERIETE